MLRIFKKQLRNESSASSPNSSPKNEMNVFTTPSNEPPPAYTPALKHPITFGQVPDEDRYAFLSSFDTIFVIDDSSSMEGPSWHETRKALEIITPICTAHDADGIDIYFLNHGNSYQNVTTPANVTDIFSSVRPIGGTPTGQRLYQILTSYLNKYQAALEGAKPKPINIIVITDGQPSDNVESSIIAAAKKLDQYDALAWQVGIQFFQVGKEPGAKEHLEQLDNKLADISGQEGLRDIVDTVPFTGEEGTELTADGILKVVLGAVKRQLDRMDSKELHHSPNRKSCSEFFEGRLV